MDARRRPRQLVLLLAAIPPDLPLWDAGDDVIGDGSPADRLWHRLREGHWPPLPAGRRNGVGPVTAGRLLAAKRPHLIPIWDSQLRDALQPPSKQYWFAMRNALDPQTRAQVEDVRREARLEYISVLRIVEVVVWMHQNGHRFMAHREAADDESVGTP